MSKIIVERDFFVSPSDELNFIIRYLRDFWQQRPACIRNLDPIYIGHLISICQRLQNDMPNFSYTCRNDGSFLVKNAIGEVFFEGLPWYRESAGAPLHRPYRFFDDVIEIDCATAMSAVRFTDRHNRWTIDFSLSTPGFYSFK